MSQTPKELEQNIDWLKSHYYALLKRVQDLEAKQLTVAVSSYKCEFDTATRETTGEML